MANDPSKSKMLVSEDCHLDTGFLLHMTKRRKHYAVSFGRAGQVYMILGYVVILHASRKFRVNVIIMKVSRSTKRDTKIGIQCVSTPERPPTTLDFDVIQATRDSRSSISVQTNSKSQVCDNAELTPAVIDTRPGPEIIALKETCLNAGESYRATLF